MQCLFAQYAGYPTVCSVSMYSVQCAVPPAVLCGGRGGAPANTVGAARTVHRDGECGGGVLSGVGVECVGVECVGATLHSRHFPM